MAERAAEIRELCDELSRLEGACEQLRGEAEAAVVDWRWARVGSGLGDPRPFSVERSGDPPGRLLGGPPRRKADGEELGLDAAGRVVVERAFDDLDALSFEAFTLQDGQGRYQVSFERGAPAVVMRLREDGGRLSGAATCARRGHWSQEHYRYDGDRIAEIAQATAAPGEEPVTARWELSYDAGRLLEITLVEGPGAPTRAWTRPARSRTTLERDVVDGLTGAIERAVTGLDVGEPVYCLALAYDAELPPSIGLGLERERADLTAEDAWNPAEFELYGDRVPGFALDGDPALADDCRELSQRLREQEQEFEGAQAVCNAVAKRLNALDWAGRLPTTDDFVVYAVDLELADLEQNLRAVFGRRRVRRLAKQGRLPDAEDGP